MSSQYLPVFISNAGSDLEELLGGMSRGDVGLKDALAFCQLCRIRGIGALFLDGVPDTFQRELCRSGRAFLNVLQRLPDEEKVTSKCIPFFDAIASNDMDCARAIAWHARASWNAEEEYEDDFLYMFLLMQIFFLNGTVKVCEALLHRYEEVRAGASDVGLNLCRAFLAQADPEFQASLRALLAERKERTQWLVRQGVVPQEVEVTEARLSVEGLALVRLARARGLRTMRNYWGVPSVAMVEAPARYVPELLKHL